MGIPARKGAFTVSLVLVRHKRSFILLRILGTKGQGGFVAIPEVGTTVLIIRPDNSSEYFYMSTIADNPTSDNATINSPVLPNEAEAYDFRGVPMGLGLFSPKGHKLAMVDSYNPESFNIKIEMKSHLGKSIVLNDSPEADCIINTK